MMVLLSFFILLGSLILLFGFPPFHSTFVSSSTSMSPMAKIAINLNEKFPEDEGFVGSEDSVQQCEATEAKQLASGSEVKPAPAEPLGSKVSVAKLGSQPVIPGAPVNDTWKKIQRAERFGVPVQLSEHEKRFSRAERFGIGSSMVKSEELKRKARAERFGLPVAPAPVDEEAKKKARLERFNTNAKNEEDKRKARAARFSNSPSSITQASTKAAVAEGASGGT